MSSINPTAVTAGGPEPVELLAPAKNLATGVEAIRHGADAVYIGGPAFGARSAAGNTVDDIRQLCRYAHTFGARVYVTLNTILYDDELSDVQRLVGELYEAGVDALITQDLALLSLDIPPIALHASTQMDNCTPECARFLEAAGYSQIVLARELSLADIRAVHAATSLPLEAFVHGALCVSYSGRCYASEYCFGRSANRGRCAQFCRLAFDLVDAEGRVIEHDRHLLSLRDMNRSASIEEMLDAGIRSFKIEGRLKDPAYVKNVTAYYRQTIDAVLARRSSAYVRSSHGIHQLTFQPELVKSFNRGFTEYLLHGRTADLWNFHTPKSMGEYVGIVQRMGRRALDCRLDVPVNNGDGLVFINTDGHLDGFRANRVEGSQIYPLKMPSVSTGTALYRNEDRAWETLLAGKTAERRLPLRLTLGTADGRYTLRAEFVPDGTAGRTLFPFSITFDHEVQEAQRPQDDNIRQNLSKLGDTPFLAVDVTIDTPFPCFVPASVLGKMRRQFTEAYERHLQDLHLASRDRRRPADASALDLHDARYSYTANVANSVARRWLADYGAHDVAPAFEIERPAQGALMTCRHCLRYALGQCPKVTGHRPSWTEPLSLRLPDQRSFTLHFDCVRCEMQVLMPSKGTKRP